MDGAEDAFRRMKRLELESDALDRRYEIFYGAQDEELWVKQLFSPSFIVWLTEQPPKDFAFELSAGSLCVNVKNHLDNATDRRYAGSVIVNEANSRFFEPAPPRNWLAAVSVRYRF